MLTRVGAHVGAVRVFARSKEIFNRTTSYGRSERAKHLNLNWDCWQVASQSERVTPTRFKRKWKFDETHVEQGGISLGMVWNHSAKLKVDVNQLKDAPLMKKVFSPPNKRRLFRLLFTIYWSLNMRCRKVWAILKIKYLNLNFSFLLLPARPLATPRSSFIKSGRTYLGLLGSETWKPKKKKVIEM